MLGTEELMQLPLRLAQALAEHRRTTSCSPPPPARPCSWSTSPGYAMRSGITFPAHDDPADGPGPPLRLQRSAAAGDPPWDHVLVVVDPPADTPALRTGLLAGARPAHPPHDRAW